MEIKKLRKRELVDLVLTYEDTISELEKMTSILQQQVEEKDKLLEKKITANDDDIRITYLKNRIRVCYNEIRCAMYKKRLNYLLY